ncbi:hypothetical protein DFH07DRAFT_981741 [Mycena maculata]|uniref:Uncharacterized protein n=1 Tax=Mycena maculata TaxID=230809 RepID=A0AAD7N133_9AGAR|nr:hypothetical protein DFH07DRAFT_981741 [Mycena maculata]
MFAPSASTKSARAAARERITELDAEIESLQRLLEARLFERDKHQAELDTYIYPVLTLPPEITSEIFTHFLPAAALSPPTLWNAIELHIDDPKLNEYQLPLLETWLTRSGGCPLSIALLCDYPTTISTGAFVEAIVCHASRWQEIELELPYEELRHVTGIMPLLHTLAVGPNGELKEEAPVSAPVVLCTQAPNLKEAMLLDCFNPFCITLPWSQITKLTATAMYDSEAVAILRGPGGV